MKNLLPTLIIIGCLLTIIGCAVDKAELEIGYTAVTVSTGRGVYSGQIETEDLHKYIDGNLTELKISSVNREGTQIKQSITVDTKIINYIMISK